MKNILLEIKLKIPGGYYAVIMKRRKIVVAVAPVRKCVQSRPYLMEEAEYGFISPAIASKVLETGGRFSELRSKRIHNRVFSCM